MTDEPKSPLYPRVTQQDTTHKAQPKQRLPTGSDGAQWEAIKRITESWNGLGGKGPLKPILKPRDSSHWARVLKEKGEGII